MQPGAPAPLDAAQAAGPGLFGDLAEGDGVEPVDLFGHDGAIPAGASVAVCSLLRVGLACDAKRELEIAERYIAQRAPESNPFVASRLLAALDLYLHGVEIVITEGDGRDALLETARRAYAPTRLIAGSWAAESILDGKAPAADGRAQAYVCRGQTCSAPVTTADALLAELSEG